MLHDISEKLLQIIRRAGKIMTNAHDIHNVTKQKGNDAANMVTAYDVAVQDFLIKEITTFIPEAFFFSEEKENNVEDLARKYCFVIDPIDGTANFVHNYKKSAISVALFSYSQIIFAAIYNPYLDEMFSASKDEGAFLNGKPIHVAERDMSHAFVAFGTSPYYKDTLAEKTFQLAHDLYMCSSDVRRSGTAALDLAYLAAGRNDIFFELLLSPWDYAAGSLIISEAGGKISNFNGEPLDYSKPSPIFAASSKLYEEALKIVKFTLK